MLGYYAKKLPCIYKCLGGISNNMQRQKGYDVHMCNCFSASGSVNAGHKLVNEK